MSLEAGASFLFNKLHLTVHSHAAMGGFSSVYIVKSETQTYVLKRSCVPPDQKAYQNAINEIEILVNTDI